MKKRNVFLGLMTGLFMVSLSAVAQENSWTKHSKDLPENVHATIEQKCFGCHNTDSRNDKGKEKLDFQKLDELSLIKKVGTYSNIVDVMEKHEMPPEKFLERFPDHNITEEQRTLIKNWAKKEAEALVKGS